MHLKFKLGQWLVSEAERRGRPVDIYSLGDIRVGVVEMIDWVQSIEKGNVSKILRSRSPLNWVDTPGLRLGDITESDFLLLEDIRSPNVQDGGGAQISTWPEEVERFKQFAYLERGVEKNGLELVADGSVKLLRVVDKRRFGGAIQVWATSIRWENDFAERNAEFLEAPR